jgi:8-oxo-dGTP diphosphatase
MVTVGGVSGLIVQDGKVLLIRRGKEPYKDHWSLPGGGVEPGETLRHAVKREMREETGLDVEVGLVAGRYGAIVAFHVEVTGGELCAGDDAAECELVDPRQLGDRLLTPALRDVFRDAGLV